MGNKIFYNKDKEMNTNKQDEEEKSSYMDLVNQKEQPLTEEEGNIDFTKMNVLQLGEE